MLDNFIIQPSSSLREARGTVIKKKDVAFRFCVDCLSLNAVTKKGVYHLPRIDDTLDRLRHSLDFSSINLKSGYWQIEVGEKDPEISFADPTEKNPV